MISAPNTAAILKLRRMSGNEALGWLQTHLSQPWCASAGAQQVTPELLEALPELLPTLDPLHQQVSTGAAEARRRAAGRRARSGWCLHADALLSLITRLGAQGALLLLLHLPRKTFAACAASLARLVEAARSPDACESARVMGALLRTFVADGAVRPSEAAAAMGPQVAELRAALLEAAAGAEPRLPDECAYVAAPHDDAPGAAPPAGAPAGAGAARKAAGCAEAGATGAPPRAEGAERALFAVRAGYVDPLAKNRSLQPPPKPLVRPAGCGATAAAAGAASAHAVAPAAPAAKPPAAAAAIKAAAARKAAAAAAAPKKRSIMMVDDDPALAQLAQREGAAPKPKRR